MGWILSPAYFCMSIETERDMGELYKNALAGTIPPQPLINK